jgi:hypothetical protein
VISLGYRIESAIVNTKSERSVILLGQQYGTGVCRSARSYYPVCEHGFDEAEAVAFVCVVKARHRCRRPPVVSQRVADDERCISAHGICCPPEVQGFQPLVHTLGTGYGQELLPVAHAGYAQQTSCNGSDPFITNLRITNKDIYIVSLH